MSLELRLEYEWAGEKALRIVLVPGLGEKWVTGKECFLISGVGGLIGGGMGNCFSSTLGSKLVVN